MAASRAADYFARIGSPELNCPDYKVAVHRVQWQRGVSSFVCAQPLKHMLDSFGWAHSHAIWSQGPPYSHLIWSGNRRCFWTRRFMFSGPLQLVDASANRELFYKPPCRLGYSLLFSGQSCKSADAKRPREWVASGGPRPQRPLGVSSKLHGAGLDRNAVFVTARLTQISGKGLPSAAPCCTRPPPPMRLRSMLFRLPDVAAGSGDASN